MGAPHATPPGWQVYHAPEFSLALPSDWWVEVNVGLDGRLPTRRITYNLYAPEDDLRGSVDVFDQLTPTQYHDGFCAPMIEQRADTFAGLPMRYTTGDGPSAAFERIWTFASDRGIVYQLLTSDGPDGAVERTAQNRAVLETFAPQYATWGCR